MAKGKTSLPSWPAGIFAELKRYGVSQVGYVPDAGHSELIRLAHAERSMAPVVLTTEEEGVALVAGAALGGARAVLLMQSSGVGNCTNMLSLIRMCGFPFLALVTMRGEWGEFNPWQVPMGSIVEDMFRLTGVQVLRADHADDVVPSVSAAARMAYEGSTAMAVLLSQRLIGAKDFRK